MVSESGFCLFLLPAGTACYKGITAWRVVARDRNTGSPHMIHSLYDVTFLLSVLLGFIVFLISFILIIFYLLQWFTRGTAWLLCFILHEHSSFFPGSKPGLDTVRSLPSCSFIFGLIDEIGPWGNLVKVNCVDAFVSPVLMSQFNGLTNHRLKGQRDGVYRWGHV